METEIDVFCVFEGGGAKGVAHVGFLTALDKHRGYRVRGYAGTSAGAVVAALAAAGWRGEELFREVDGRPTSEAVEYLNSKRNERIRKLSDFIDPAGWRKIKILKLFVGMANRSGEAGPEIDVGNFIRTAILWYGLMVFLVLVVCIWKSMHHEYSSWILASFLLLIIAVPAMFLAAHVFGRHVGFASMDRPQELLEELLRAKVPKHSKSGVTFRDVELETNHSLKIVAADLENGSLKLFGNKSTPDALVSSAVAASAAIPLLFRPVEIDGRQYCDGGIVSNLPAWAFDSERLVDLSCLTVTCEVSPPSIGKISRPRLRGFRLISRVAITATFGSAGLNTRGLLRHIPLSTWASFNMLDFDKMDQQGQLIRVSVDHADIKMDLERNHRNSIDGLFAKLKDKARERGLEAERLRVSYARRVTLLEEPPSAYHLWNCRGFDGYADAGIILPVSDSFLGETMQGGGERFFNLSDPATANRYRSVGNGNLRDRLPADRGWIAVVAVPDLSRHGRVSVAVCIDGADTVHKCLEDDLLRDFRTLVMSSV